MSFNFTRNLYIFDLDGTLACCKHRQHLIQGDKPDWSGFYSACDQDAPIWPVISTMERLRRTADIWIFSGRSDEVRGKTVSWLKRHTSFTLPELNGPILTMRPEGDYTPDDQLKRQWHENMLEYDRDRLTAIFDDRSKVVSMWRSLGIPCFQVAEGDF